MRGKMKLIHGDCLKEMFDIPDNSVDMVCCDMPYGTTSCKWDVVLPLDMLWYHYKRICRYNAAIVLFASQPFTTRVVNSNLKGFKYQWVWNKKLAGNGILAKKQPLKIHEDILVFNSKVYKPEMRKGKGRWKGGIKDKHGTFSNSESKKVWSDEYYPVSILDFSGGGVRTGRVHPTQKPVALIEYLIKTYTNEGDTVLDNCMGSGTTGVACKNLNRDFIGIEIDKEYFEIAKQRIEGTQYNQSLNTDGEKRAAG